MTLLNIPATPVGIKMEDIKHALAHLTIITPEVTLADIETVHIDGEYVTVTYIKPVKGAMPLRVERKIRIIQEPYKEPTSIEGQRPNLMVVDEVADFTDVRDIRDPEAAERERVYVPKNEISDRFGPR